jgi:hypothetical protein
LAARPAEDGQSGGTGSAQDVRTGCQAKPAVQQVFERNALLDPVDRLLRQTDVPGGPILLRAQHGARPAPWLRDKTLPRALPRFRPD